MNRLVSAFAALLVTLLLTSTPAPGAEDWNEVEPVAKSLVRLERLSHDVSAGVVVRIKQRGLVSEEGYEEIAVETAKGLCRAIGCLRRAFFEGAPQEEIEDRLYLVEALAARVHAAAGRIGIYGITRESLAALLNEKDALKKHLGLP